MECGFQLGNGEPGVLVLWPMLDTYCFRVVLRAFRNVLNNE